MKKIRHILFFLLFVINSVQAFSIEVISNKMIWQGENYAAFTSLVYYKGYFYCAFRNANKHYDPSGEDCGVIKIIRSKNSDKWEEFLSFEEDGYDLRDPQLSITPDKRIMLLTEKVQYKEGKALSRQTCISFINKKGKYTVLSPIVFSHAQNNNWIWNIEWINGIAYGFIYVPYFGFVKSNDGSNWQVLQKITLDNSPSEASVISMDNDNYLAVVRRNINALIGKYDIKTSSWEWHDSGVNLGCPKIIKIEDRIIVLGRDQGKEKQTAIFQLNINNMSLEKIIGVKGQKDTAYPGVVYRKDILYVSYYNGDGKKGDIYFVKIKMD